MLRKNIQLQSFNYKRSTTNMQLRSGKIVNNVNDKQFQVLKREVFKGVTGLFNELNDITTDNEKYYRCEVVIDRSKKISEIFQFLSQDKYIDIVRHKDFANFLANSIKKCREVSSDITNNILELRNKFHTRYVNNEISQAYYITKMHYYSQIECECLNILGKFEDIYI
jgi:hypothetical protein